MTGSGCGRCGAEERDAFICRVCTKELDRAIGDMTSLLHEVSVLATGQTNVYRSTAPPQLHADEAEWDDEQHSIPAWLRSREGRIALPPTPLMVNLDARDLLADAYDTLLTWACMVGADEISSVDVVPWLLRHINDARFHEDAAQMHDEITYLHRRMESAVDRSPSRLYAGPCQNDLDGQRCERDLYAWPNADEIVCDGYRADDAGCGATHTPEDRHDWLVATLDDALLPLDLLRMALPRLLPDLPHVPPATWRSWTFRGRIIPHTVANGVELYRGGDVIQLLADAETRQRPRRTA
jgi:hypothetical protein